MFGVTLFEAFVAAVSIRDGRRSEWEWIQSNQRNRLTLATSVDSAARQTHLEDDRYDYVTQSSHYTYTQAVKLLRWTEICRDWMSAIKFASQSK